MRTRDAARRLIVTRVAPADAGPPPKLGPVPTYLLRGGLHVAKPRAGTKGEKKRQAIREQTA